MISSVYMIFHKKIYVYCEIEEYCQQLRNWLSTYEELHSNEYDFYIKVYKNKAIWISNGIVKYIDGKIKHTDLYPLFYNVISNCILDNNNILLHSAVLCYNGIGILIVGDFNSGKTTLCLEAIKNNIEVISADQTHLQYKKNMLTLYRGSSYMKSQNNNEKFLNNNVTGIEIRLIINIEGVCEKGMLCFTKSTNEEHIIKKMFKYCTWHSDIPLFTNNMMLDINRVKVFKWLSRINVPFYSVRGDSNSIISKIKEELK